MIIHPSNLNTSEVEADTRNKLILGLGYRRPVVSMPHSMHIHSLHSVSSMLLKPLFMKTFTN